MQEALKLKNQVCFPLYAASREITRRYTPFLDKLNLTYTQYICMMLLWEKRMLSVKELGEQLYLDSGTLTPLLKKLESKGYIARTRSAADERRVDITLTEAGDRLQEQAAQIPSQMAACVGLDAEDADTLYRILYRILGKTDT